MIDWKLNNINLKYYMHSSCDSCLTKIGKRLTRRNKLLSKIDEQKNVYHLLLTENKKVLTFLEIIITHSVNSSIYLS